MSTEREPMFHRVEMLRMIWRNDPAFFDDHPTPEEAYKRAVDECNGVVERLITTGKLRVVEECQVYYNKSVHNMPMYGCKPEIPLGGGSHCPYCGNPIKR